MALQFNPGGANIPEDSGLPAADLPDTGDEPGHAEQPDVDESPNSEAARYRHRLREAESERDYLAATVAGYRRTEVEAALADVLDVPADIFDIGGADVADFYDDDGTLKTDELTAAATALTEKRPRLARTPSGRPNWGQHSGSIPAGSAWDHVLRG